MLQVLRRPDLDLTVENNWVQFASTFTSTQPSYFNDPDQESPLYYWSSISAPVPNDADAGRWPVGGLVRTRAQRIDADGQIQQLPTFAGPSPTSLRPRYAPKAVTDPTAVWSDDYVPNGWQSNLHDIGTYKGIIKKGCRTCHMSGLGSLDFLEEEDWALLGRAAVIRGDVCGPSHDMPQAERVSKNFWASGGRAYLITGWPVSPNDHLQGCAP